MNIKPIITLDIDWISDCVIQDVAQLLLERRVKSTWFVTHATPALDVLRQHPDLFELGIHPNFKEGSSHGQTMAEVVDHCLRLVPEAVSARSHGLIQSDYLWRHYALKGPIRFECSTFVGRVPRTYAVRFHWDGGSLLRVPYVYQDNLEMSEPNPIWEAKTFLEGKHGLQIFDFHPFYVYTNSTSMDIFERVKQTTSHMQEITEKELQPFRQTGTGARTMFLSLIDYLARNGGGARVKDLVAFNETGESPICAPPA